MKIQVTKKTNLKLLEYFPIDPYYDIVIISKETTYELQIAFLLIQSSFFEQLCTKNVQSINLTHLQQPYLNRVLKALYGDQLFINCFQEFKMIYRVIDELQIQQYKISIIEQINKNLNVWDPIELLQICLINNILEQKIKKLYFSNNLQILQDQKYYLQLAKISVTTMNLILESYYQYKPSEQTQHVICNILQNYMNRKKQNIQTYFSKNKCLILKNIWQKYHQILIDNRQFNSIKQRILVNNTIEPNPYDVRIMKLQAIINQKNMLIQKLKTENNQYKSQVLSNESKSLFQNNSSLKSNSLRKSNEIQQISQKMKLSDFNFENSNSKNQNILNSNSIIQFDDQQFKQVQIHKKVIATTQQSKTMNQLKNHNRTRKIFR